MYILYNIRYNCIVIVRKIYLIYKNEFLISIFIQTYMQKIIRILIYSLQKKY